MIYKKKYILYFILILYLISPKFVSGQINIFVSTYKNIYAYKEDIKITITAYNPTDHLITLTWGDLYQSNYYIDNYKPSVFVAQIPSSITIAPYSSYSWEKEHKFNLCPINSGPHSVIGEVVNYGKSSPKLIIVSPVTDIINIKDYPKVFALSQNYPNPFNPSTTIRYTIPKQSFVTLKIYNVLGEEIKTLVNKELNIGVYELKFNANNLASGIYFYSLKAGGFISTRKLILMK